MVRDGADTVYWVRLGWEPLNVPDMSWGQFRVAGWGLKVALIYSYLWGQ